jgi:hypothetical protein
VNNLGLQIPVLGNMSGNSGRLFQNNGNIAFERPSQLRIELGYINIQNTTENTLNIYGLSDDTASSTPSYRIGSYMSISLKLNQKLAEGVIITYVNPNPSTTNDIKPLEIIWSEGSLNWNSTLAPSYTSNYTGSSVNVINTPDVHVTNIPAVTVNGTPNVAVTSIPTVNVDIVDTTSFDNDYVTVPMTVGSANVATSLTQAGVVGKSWYLCYANWRVSGSAPVGVSNLAVTIKDGATIIYRSAIPTASINGTSLSIEFPHPIKITAGNSFTLDIDTPNSVGCIIYANIGAFNK